MLFNKRTVFGTVVAISVVSMMSLGSVAPVWASEDKSDKSAAADPNASKPAVPVSYEEAVVKDISQIKTYSGRVEAIESVELNARVLGYVETRNFEEGQMVKKGDLLFQLDQSLYKNAVDQATAAVDSSQAQVVYAQQEFERQQKLTARDVQSVARLDEATATRDTSRANVLAAKASLEQAQINLNYTEIRSPIDGLTGRALASTGDLVGPSSGPLVTIVSQDPMYVSFPVPQREVLEIRRREQKGDAVTFELGLPDGSIYTQQGKFAFANNQSTASTDSLLVRISMPNPQRLLVDQTLVDVRILSKNKIEALTVPQQALLLDQEGTYVFVVGKDDKAEIKRIKTGEQRKGYIVVETGLQAGDKVIVTGLQKIQPGVTIKATPVTLQSGDTAASDTAASDSGSDSKSSTESSGDKSTDSGSNADSGSESKN